MSVTIVKLDKINVTISPPPLSPRYKISTTIVFYIVEFVKYEKQKDANSDFMFELMLRSWIKDLA